MPRKNNSRGRGGGSGGRGGGGGGGRGGGGNKFNSRGKGFNRGRGGISKPKIENENFRKFKLIRRNQETEEALRQQKALEIKIQKKNEVLESSSDEEEQNPLDQLLSSFQTSGTKKRSAIESSDSESEDDDESMDDEEDDNEEEIVENDDEMGEEEEDESDSDDDFPEETLNLKPEESKQKKVQLDDTIESDGSVETEEELDEEVENAAKVVDSKNSDIFAIHLDNELSPELLECVNTTLSSKTHDLNWPKLGRLQVDIPKVDGDKEEKPKKKNLLDSDEVFAATGTVPTKIDHKNIDLNSLLIKNQIKSNVVTANKVHLDKNLNSKVLTSVQSELFSIMNNYQDLYYPQRSHENGEEIRFTYCLHALNHILKTRTKILHHNAKLGKTAGSKAPTIVPESYRDQGLFRPKILIVVPFRESALRVVNILISLIFPQLGATVMHYNRFLEEFGGEGLYFPKKNPKPEDYELTFAGNSDDTFRIGISLTRKCMKLYSDFYTSDILIASPLGLRMIVGAPGEKERDYDFLASIELLILDQADLFLAQNWDHLLHVLDHLHLQPQAARNTDFSRVRSWCLNGWSRFYRQTLLFTTHELPEFRSLFNSRCSNYRGKVRVANPILSGSIRHVAVQIPQVFHRIDVTSIQSSFDQRFTHFVNTILPQFKSATMAHCLVFVPSYFDFVRIRNYFKKESMNFVQICEYTKDGKMARSRDMFFHSGAHFLLYSERAHFFRRTRIKGIRHLIMYQPPTWPHFYSEMINLMQESYQNPRDGGDSSMTVTILYTKYDMLQISSIVGSDRAVKMGTSEKTTHMFMTGE